MPTQLSMNETLAFLVRHGAVVLIAAVFIEQAGAPLPAAPWLFAAGALVGAGKMNWMMALGAAAFGSLLADAIWFYLGRRYGNRLLGLMCRISLTPDTCVRRTQNVFTRYGMQGIVAAKFIPGLSTLAPPLAGSLGVTAPRFLLFDGMGSLLYVGCFLLVGVLFSRQLEQILAALASLGGNALGLIAAFVAVYIAYKYFQRRRLLRDLRVARITVDELHKKLEAGENCDAPPLARAQSRDVRSRREVSARKQQRRFRDALARHHRNAGAWPHEVLPATPKHCGAIRQASPK